MMSYFQDGKRESALRSLLHLQQRPPTDPNEQ